MQTRICCVALRTIQVGVPKHVIIFSVLRSIPCQKPALALLLFLTLFLYNSHIHYVKEKLENYFNVVYR